MAADPVSSSVGVDTNGPPGVMVLDCAVPERWKEQEPKDPREIGVVGSFGGREIAVNRKPGKPVV